MKKTKKSNRLNANKKGLSGPALIGTFILVFLMVFGLIALYSKVMKGGTKVLECNANGGDCVTGTCDFATQIPALSDKAAGCESGELCCINITKSAPPINPKCANASDNFNKNKATPCGTRMYCDTGSQCVTQCEFCAKNFYTVEGRPVCGTGDDAKPKNTIFENMNYANKALSCNCTKAQCDTKTKTGECISLFCPTTKPDTFCCTTT